MLNLDVIITYAEAIMISPVRIYMKWTHAHVSFWCGWLCSLCWKPLQPDSTEDDVDYISQLQPPLQIQEAKSKS